MSYCEGCRCEDTNMGPCLAPTTVAPDNPTYLLALDQDALFNLTSIVGDTCSEFGIYGRLLKIIDDNKLGTAYHDFDDAYLAAKAVRNG